MTPPPPFTANSAPAGKPSPSRVPCVIFEDEHLLVVNKPAGLNTHAPAPFAGEGLYDWLRHREPRWASLAIIHRLDKEASGVMVFAKTPLANRSLTAQFASRQVRKKYLLLTDRPVKPLPLTVVSTLVRVGDHYASLPERRPPARHEAEAGARAETLFTESEETLSKLPFLQSETPAKLGRSGAAAPAALVLQPPRLQFGSAGVGARRTFADEASAPLRSVKGAAEYPPSAEGLLQLTAEPLTGRTHQIRVHAAESRFPILGDTLYGGTPAPRLYLHAAELFFRHPATGEALRFTASADFDADPRLALRSALVDDRETDAFRLIHGAADGWLGWHVDRLGDFLLSQSEQALDPSQQAELQHLSVSVPTGYHKTLLRRVRQTTTADASPQLVFGPPAPERFPIRENGVRFELSFGEGYSVGLFLDQRDNRRRFLTGHVAAGFPLANVNRPLEMLNVFAYTCGFSVCAALAGARTTSLDLSKKYLEWGKRNFALNGLDPAMHDFIYGDAFDWLRRLAKKRRAFDALALDPPTFAQSKESGVWQAERHYGKLVTAALPLLKPGGVLFASTNAADWKPEDFLNVVRTAIAVAGRTVAREHYCPQPPDFPVTRSEPAYLKTAWLRVG